MADTKLTALTADTSPTKDDIIYVVNDPSGTPGERKVTLENALTKPIAGFTSDTSPTIDDVIAVLDDPGGTPAAKKVALEYVRNLVLSSSYLQYRDEKSAGTAGGTFTSGAWQTRTLNTEVTDVGGYGSLSSNQITLTAGTYRIYATAPAYFVDSHQSRLQNITDNTTILIGSTEYADNTGNGSMSRSIVCGVFTIAASKAIELQHRCNATKSGDGFGDTANFAVTEVYSIVELWKIG